ncbi:unnamed protein product [Lupinus luteus]|uniref:Heparanase-like protein 3 n=1 Tax=Lupinus luteus TaxID=3873 RepID=A0AAV1XXR6_LUPLU
MGSQIRPLMTMCSYLLCFSFIVVNAANEEIKGSSIEKGFVFINETSFVGKIEDDFVCATLDWWPAQKCDYGRCSWGLASILNLDLKSNVLLNAVKAFSPLKIRLGGTLQDKVTYETENYHHPCTPFVHNTTEMFDFTKGCLPMQRAKIIFGLNALDGKSIKSGSAVGPWNHTNAESFIRYTVKKNYTIHGWELGNELSGKGIGASISAEQYVSDVSALRRIIEDVYRGIQPKPLVISPGGFFDATWFKEFVTKAGKSVDVITHHIYNLGPGVDEHITNKILDPSYLDGEARTFNSLKNILQSSGTSATAWVGEAGGAYNSGHHLVSDAFVNSFCALLWHQLMGQRVLAARFSGTEKIRAYAHCAKQSKGITILLLNLGNSTVLAEVSLNFTKPPHDHVKFREEYHLSSQSQNIHSQVMLLNGQILSVNKDGAIPPLKPINVDPSKPIVVTPLSVVFAHIPDVIIPACT